jgi:hypothetical protein
MREAGEEEVRPAEAQGQEDQLEQGHGMSSRGAGIRPIHGAWLCVAAALCALCMALAGTVQSAAADPVFPHWDLESHAAPTNLPLATKGEKGETIPGQGELVINASDQGDGEVNGSAGGEVIVTDTLPAGVSATKVVRHVTHPKFIENPAAEARWKANETAFVCPESSGGKIRCTFTGVLQPYEEVQMSIKVSVIRETPASAAEAKDRIAIEGGGAKAEVLEPTLTINGEPTSFGVETYEMKAENENFEPDEAAGSHPFQLTTTFALNEVYGLEIAGGTDELRRQAPALERNLNFKLPPGLIGDVNAVPTCADVNFGALEEGGDNACPNSTVVGVASVTFDNPNGYSEVLSTWVVPVFNLAPAKGEPARFGFAVDHVPVVLDTSVRTGEDYGVTVTVHNASEAVQVLSSRVTFWGIPADKRHDQSRGWACFGFGSSEYRASEPCDTSYAPPAPLPFLTLPTKCEETLDAPVEGESWQGEGVGENTPAGGIGLHGRGEAPSSTSSGLAEIPNENATTGSGCGELPFNPTADVSTETEDTSTPTGLNVNVSVPQNTTLESSYKGKAEADVSATTLVLPPGIQANPGAANGLSTCSAGSVGFLGAGSSLQAELATQRFNAAPLPPEEPATVGCLSHAKIGSVEIHSPDLKETLVGGVYLGEQDTDPFSSPLVLYIVAEAPTSKVLVKLAGEVEINQTTGQLTSYFRNTPQAPFETLTLHLWNGGRASQTTFSKCETRPAVMTFASSSKEPTETVPSESEISTTSGPGGEPCPGATLPFSPSIAAAPTNTQAAADTPFVVNIGRPDGNQAIETINMKLPPGVAALISQVTPCPEAVAEADECPESSQVGTTKSFSGLGGDPVVLEGKLYLTGELTANGEHGAGPYGLLAATLAKAGPFNLGWVNVFSTINVNKETAAATVTSGRIPNRLKGVPTQLKALSVTVERPGNEPYLFNPTNCGEELKIEGTLTAYEGGSSPIDDNYPVTECSSLPFAPKLTAVVGSQGSKANGTSFDVTIESPGLGQANIHKVDLTLPEALPSRLETIQKACPEQTFYANPANCDEGSVIGEGIVHTPVFKYPLMGPAYLVSHAGAAFPDVDFVLQGEGVTIVVTGKTDIKKGITYSKFETNPDAPFTKFESIFPTGPHSALTPNTKLAPTYNLCKLALTMPTEITAQNGAFISETTKIAESGCAAVKSSKVKKLSRAQHLTKALKSCRSKYKKQKRKRVTCEKQARKKYGPKAKKSAKKAHKK